MKTATLIITFICFSATSANYLQQFDKKTQQKVKQDLLLMKQFEAIKQRQGISILTVGPGINCDTNTIQNAINAGADEVRMTNNQTYFENLVIQNISITLRGGFDDCTAADNNNQSGKATQVNGGAIESVIRVQGNSMEDFVVLENLEIRNGANNFGAGIRIIGSFGSVLIDASVIQFNTALSNLSSHGAGVYVNNNSSGPDSNLIINDTKILNNTATSGRGAGLYCSGSAVSLTLSGTTEIGSNQSQNVATVAGSGGGGGLALESFCTARIFSPSQINDNTSERGGGGIVMDSGSSLYLIGQEICMGNTCLGANDSPVKISGNRAGFPDLSDSGGAIHIIGGGTGSDNASLTSVGGLLISDNRARLGAGIYARSNAEILISRVSKPCWDSNRCTYFLNNRTTTDNGTGGAIFNDSSLVDINLAYFENNRADVATAIYSKGTGAITRIQSSVFNNNGSNASDDFNDLYVVRAFDDAKIEVVYSTFADNNANTVFGIRNSSNALTLTSSIVHDTSSGEVLVTDNGSVQINCVMVHEVTSIAGTNVSLNNPDFVDRDNRDYHLADTSPAIDYCNEVGTPFFPDVDIDFTTRGYDDPNVVNNFANSFYDIGADEVIDLIFKNSFETNSGG